MRHVVFGLLLLPLLAGGPARAADPSTDPVVAANPECFSDMINSREVAPLRLAEAACTKALDDKSLTPEFRANILQYRGVARRHLVDLKGAHADLVEAKRLAPNDAGIARMLGWTLREMGQEDAAEAEYDRALQIEPHWQGFLSRCVVRIGRQLYEKALADCEQVAKETTNEDVIYFTSLAHAYLRNYKAAILNLSVALDGQYASPRLYELLAMIHETEGRHAEAVRVLSQGRVKFPNDPSLESPKRL
jgi:tetratricopeptide (TPR) repeat protein